MSNPVPPSNPDVPSDLPQDPESSYNPDSPMWEAWVVTEDSGIDKAQSPELAESSGGPPKPPLPMPASRTNDADLAAGGFRLQWKIAEGGFGEIWEAVQLSLGRTIAIKRLKARPKPATPATARDDTLEDTRLIEFDFRQEALITAQLEHPNIIPVYDLGCDDTGRPLIAMKMVKGRMWSEILREDFTALSVDDFLAKHLPVLISVAQAVAFAHSHCILHRDLKPAQVMIGHFGEVLLMDWGLAMAFGSREEIAQSFPYFPLDSNSPLFNPINPAGTPAFMAPEQTENSPKNLGPWTDVYLLGGILYRLLTGRNPHIGTDSATTYLMARQGIVEPPEIRAPGREIPPQLASLALRAMEVNPAARLSSAEAFLTELQDFLSGAGKRRESVELAAQVAQRLEGTVREYGILADCLNQLDRALMLWPGNPQARPLRQRVLARYAEAARDSRDLKLARVQAERLHPGAERDSLLLEIGGLEEEQRRQDERLQAAYRQARIDRDRAEEARVRAEEMRARSEILVSFLIGDLHTALQSIGRLDLIRRVTQKSLEYFDSLPEVEATEQTLHNRAIAYLNIGEVFADEGRKPDALVAFQKAREIAQLLIECQPANPEWQATLADSRDRIGLVFYYQGRMDDALQEHQAALEIRKRLLLTQTGDHGIELGIATCLHKMGVIFWRQQNLRRALELHSESLDTLRRLCSADADNKEVRAAIGWNLSTLGNVYRDLGDTRRAIDVTREALNIRESLMNREPANVSRTDDFLWTQGNLALLYLFQGELEQSLELFAKYMPLRRRLSDEDPDNVVRTTAVTFPLSLMGEVLFALNRLQEAEEILQECLTVTSALFARDPTSTHIISAYARLHAQMGEVLVAQGRWEEAENLAEVGVSMGRKAHQLAPKNVMIIKVLATSLILRGRIHAHYGIREYAVRLWSEARELLGRIEIKGDEIDVLDLSTQLALLLRTERNPAPCIARLRERRWVTPSLLGVCRETGYTVDLQ